MATKKYVKDSAKEGKFGHYKTGTGGGEPIPAGKKMTTERRDPDQPRTSDGKFSYNSINGKPLKEISKVHGHSRGTTIPPTLTGGVNGVHYYSDSTHEHIVKGGQDALEKYTSFTVEEAYRKGDRIVSFRGTIKIASKDFIESASEYMANKGKEDQLTGALADLAKAKENKDKEGIEKAVSSILESGHFAGDPTGSWKERAAESPEELRAVEKAKAEKTEGSELVERKREEEVEAAPKIKKFIGWAKSYSAPTTPKAEEERKEVASAPAVATKDLSDDEIKKFAELTGAEGVSRGMLEEAIASDVISVSDIKNTLEAKAPKAEEKKEELVESVEEESGDTEEDLISTIKEDGWKKEEIVEELSKNKDFKSGVMPLAKAWASKDAEFEDKSDEDIISAYIDHIYGEYVNKEEKEDAMKDFGLRGE